MFHFKKFSVSDDQSTMKVGTDAVVLGAWADVGKVRSILDIGTGSGVIALMLAQRSAATVDAVEPDENSAQQARHNFDASPWKGRLSVFKVDVQSFEHTPYDLIVSNPPFFSNSLLPPAEQRKKARHTETLSLPDLLTSIKRLLSKEGSFAIILPYTEGNEFKRMALDNGFICNRSTAVFSREGKPQERWLLQFSYSSPTGDHEETLTLYETGIRRSKQYSELTEAFYL